MNKIIDSQVIEAASAMIVGGFLVGSISWLGFYTTMKDNEWRSKNFHDALNTTIACRKVVVKETDKICGAVPVWSQFSGRSR